MNEDQFSDAVQLVLDNMNRVIELAQREMYSDKMDGFDDFYSWYGYQMASMIKEVIKTCETKNAIRRVGPVAHIMGFLNAAYCVTRTQHPNAPFLTFRPAFINNLIDSRDTLKKSNYEEFQKYAAKIAEAH